MTGWAWHRRSGSAQQLHDLPLDGSTGRQAWVLAVDRPALVLGSTQRSVPVDAAALAADGADLARRRTGGGAVVLVPGASTWIDLVLPRRDERWDDDVAGSFGWLGEVWLDALAALGVGDAVVHRGAACIGPLGRLVCFAGLGWGEVVVGGRKLVGISQRRGRHGARFQCVVHHAWEPERYARPLAPALPESHADLAAVEVAILDVDPDQVVVAVQGSLATR